MEKSMQFIKLDLLTIKPNVKQILFVACILCISGLPANPLLLNIYIFIIGFVAVGIPFASEEQYRMDKFYAMLPVGREDIVRARYLLVVLLTLCGVVLLMIFNYLLLPIFGVKAAMTDTVPLMAIGIAVFCTMVSIQMPLHFKFGYAKTKMVAMVLPFALFMGVPALIGIAAKFMSGKNMSELISWIVNAVLSNYFSISISCIAASTLALAVSFVISLKVYRAA